MKLQIDAEIQNRNIRHRGGTVQTVVADKNSNRTLSEKVKFKVLLCSTFHSLPAALSVFKAAALGQ